MVDELAATADEERTLLGFDVNGDGVVGGSFRDPSGFVFRRDGVVYRQVNQTYATDLARLESSGLYAELVGRGLLLPYEDVAIHPALPNQAARILRPEQLPFVSYPYEWCFGELKDAALATLEIQLAALARGMTLKDASAFNIQFPHGRPTLVDTLSFETYEAGQPWVAYRQFCEHFLAPLLMVRHVDPGLIRLPELTADGIPLQTTSRLLPWTTRLRPSLVLHVHLHALSVHRFGRRSVPKAVAGRGLSEAGMSNLIESLRRTVEQLEWSPGGTQWADYENEHGYSDEAFASKRCVVERELRRIAPRTVCDLGANTGTFSRMATEGGAAYVVSVDQDPAAVERNYRRMKERHEDRLLPLCIDARNPSPNLGWAGCERESFTARAQSDLLIALAIVHHLAIGANVPLDLIANWFSELAEWVLVEFVPKSDPQAQRLLSSRKDVFASYAQADFEAAFQRHFKLVQRSSIGESGRLLYTFVSKG